jgi:nucleoside-diphosphate-sugar epimerase
MRILITGANGSIGRDLVPALLLRGHEVVALDREVEALVPHPRLRIVRGLVEDRSRTKISLFVRDLLRGFARDSMNLIEVCRKICDHGAFSLGPNSSILTRRFSEVLLKLLDNVVR